MTERIGNTIIISDEKSQQCDFCGEIKELRPYGPKGECICYDCGKKDPRMTMKMMNMVLFGDNEEEAEKDLDHAEELMR